MTAPAQRGPRPREAGISIGRGTPGPHNAITDVPGVAVGHVTVWRDEPAPPDGRGVARTGVTVVVPREPALIARNPVPAGVAVLNGAGELTGSLTVREWGVVETPVYLTSTMAVGRIYDGAVTAALAADPNVAEEVVIPVVGECDDSWLSDARLVQVDADDAGRALAGATNGPVAEGAVGAGAGMVCFGWKGGIGTASRPVPGSGATVGVLVLANFGVPRELRVDGVPVGLELHPGGEEPDPAGSCIAVVATDARIEPADLERVARRCGLGLARVGSVAHHGSGEIFLALSTAPADASPVQGRDLDELFAATVEATEEAVLNALWAAPDVTGRDGHTAPGLPHDEVLRLLAAAGRV